MPSVSVSWSTKHETTMNTPTKFRTPPMVRSFDGNNNAVNFSGDQTGKFKAEFQVGNESGLNGSLGAPLPCDDCALQMHGLILRWCDDCSSAICDACILDRHQGHAISWYQEALRSANRKLNDVLEDANCKMKELKARRVTLKRFEHEIVAKINDMKIKVQRREKEGGEIVVTMTQHLKKVEELAIVGLNARTICERRHAANAAINVGESLKEREGKIIGQLKGIDLVVSEVVAKVYGQTI